MATAAGAERSRRSGPVTRHAPIRAFGGRIAAATPEEPPPGWIAGWRQARTMTRVAIAGNDPGAGAA